MREMKNGTHRETKGLSARTRQVLQEREEKLLIRTGVHVCRKKKILTRFRHMPFLHTSVSTHMHTCISDFWAAAIAPKYCSRSGSGGRKRRENVAEVRMEKRKVRESPYGHPLTKTNGADQS